MGRSKRSVVLDVETAGGQAHLAAPLATTISSSTSSVRSARAGSTSMTASFRAGSRSRSLAPCSAWPMNHRGANLPVHELLTMARLGVCDEQTAMRRSGSPQARAALEALVRWADVVHHNFADARGAPSGDRP